MSAMSVMLYFFKSPERQIKVSVDSIVCLLLRYTYFPMEFQVVSNILAVQVVTYVILADLEGYQLNIQTFDLFNTILRFGCRNTSVNIATDYGVEGWNSIPDRGERFSSSPQHSDRLWDRTNLLPNGYRWLLLWR
jgi:hypothetical protein